MVTLSDLRQFKGKKRIQINAAEVLYFFKLVCFNMSAIDSLLIIFLMLIMMIKTLL